MSQVLNDESIIELYFQRDENAITETNRKYGSYLFTIANTVLHCEEDSHECVNDTYMKAWQTMPPERPRYLSAFLSKITRNLSINRYLKNKSKSKMLMTERFFDEISECIPDTSMPISEDIALRDAINSFLASLPDTQRKMFVKRYFYMMTVKEISSDMRTSASNVKVTLMRTREKFKAYLEKAGISV